MKKSLLEMNNIEAKEFFMKTENYCTIELPEYFNFTNLLIDIDNNIKDKIDGDYLDGTKLKNSDSANYKIVNNKDGLYDWRPLQIINPLLYVRLVNIITNEENWNILLNRFRKFEKFKKNKIICCSIPSDNDEKNNTENDTLSYWSEFEQKSIQQNLFFNCIGTTDITNCYGSIYTHSISWAINGIKKAKEMNGKDKFKNNLGEKLDKSIQQMQYNQTNGIPQGSKLMDLIAEIVLGYTDSILALKLKKDNITDYKILRYRDDYRVFAKDTSTIKRILKVLSECLLQFNFKLNPKKTFIAEDIITYSIKEAKLPEIEFEIINEIGRASNNSSIGNRKISLQKILLLIREFAKKYTNTRQCSMLLSAVIPIVSKKNKYENINSVVSIIVDIMVKNPISYPSCIALLSNILKDVELEEKEKYINEGKEKLKQLPNCEYLDIWLQRLTIKINPNEKYNCKLCQKVYEDNKIWDDSWIKGDKNKIDETQIIDRACIENLNEIIQKCEVDKFNDKYENYDNI